MSIQGLWDRLGGWVGLNRLRYPIPAHARHPFYTLGGITFVGIALLFLSGLYLTQFFNPDPEQAGRSIRALSEEVPGGRWIRSLHYWTAQAVVIALLLHLVRVFISGAYKPPRTPTWIFGVALFFAITLGSYFSGTAIKGDQEGFEALHHYKIIMEALGPLGIPFSEHLSGAVPLNLRMYTFHIALAPLIILFLVAGHFVLVNVFNFAPLSHGATARQREVPREELTGTLGEHLRSIALFSLIYYGAVAVLAFWVPAPVGPSPLDHFTGEKPAWVYLWLYGLEHFTGMEGILYGNVALLILMLLLPVLDRGASRDPRDRKGTLSAGGLVIAVMAGFALFAWIAPPEVHHHGQGHHMEEPPPPPHDHNEAPAPDATSHSHDDSDPPGAGDHHHGN